ncbi:3'-5'-bisphosphate nucleotidase [Sulfurovum lithotrophicum]|uniref:3'(2'),5'-bisphosphate nucleotidase CysQ n=1 Tax=Sulfurovum lithotrophicum TaxID=206403 RepID=A0A7U4LZU7_9BACT|nr:3'(2'),5'-bisphosphate nucleotidase CysQ [Sulfurovum lithotrophicum]AKF24212.1 3'-5'-bisphosphate nucleotidase [Sulfurovum lithotrophicum]
MLDKIDLNDIQKIAQDAGNTIMEIYNRDFSIEYKDDKSPLTEADTASHEVIMEGLEKYGIPVMSEEGKTITYDERKGWEYYWCVDPIDGTKEFIKKNGEFTVNIALIHKDTPVLGVVYAPALGDMYKAKKGEGAFKNDQKLPLCSNPDQKEKMSVVASKSHLSEETQAFIDALDTRNIEQVSKGSSLKLCMVAEGEADIYPRLAPTMEWDTAAADAVVRESGKMTCQFENDRPVVYNKENLLNPWFVVK